MGTEITSPRARQTTPNHQILARLDHHRSMGSKTNAPKYCTFYHITRDEQVWFGQSFKNKRELSFQEYSDALELIKDEEIFPLVPEGVELTIAPDHLNDDNAYVKRPGLNSYEEFKGTDFVTKQLLDKTLIMEQISNTPHPNIVHYHGCRVRWGRITAIVVERLDQTLEQYVDAEEGYEQLDNEQFLVSLQSALDYFHSLGLAHNDISSYNIMLKDDKQPVLIDFGSCEPYGGRLQSCGSPGWCEEPFFLSEKKHDDFSMKRLAEWLKEKDEANAKKRESQSE
ncbi:kinase-like domain-containing protein [Podospora fimiseda]|uniref:Kinase-like domain-containing protein n=1 Tax=Podospora fimiseda TaxID=252190 RepID=A0AAN7BEL4_9PEZI|nr:kinase-like domain-containing protein [Podospora fimiseda]